MVKITDPRNNSNSKEVNNNDNSETQKLTPELIKEMIKQQDKQDKKETTQLNLRLETSISNQIELQAIQEDTTKTEIIKEILTDFYNHKTLTKGTFKLKRPVTLMIPKNEKLLNDYIEHGINIVSSLKLINHERYINPLDPQTNLYETKNYDTITLTQTNNLLDKYDSEKKCYYGIYTPEYVFEEENEEETYYYSQKIEDLDLRVHKGLMFISFENDIKNLKTILIKTVCIDNALIICNIINTEEALKLAKALGDPELIIYINQLDEYNRVDELVGYNTNFENLLKQYRELERNFKVSLQENLELKEEMGIIKDGKYQRPFEEEDNELQKYIKELEFKNIELTRKLKEHEKRGRENEKLILEIRDLIKQ